MSFYIAKKKYWEKKFEEAKNENPELDITKFIPYEYYRFKVSSKSNIKPNWKKEVKFLDLDKIISEQLNYLKIDERIYNLYKLAFERQLKQKEIETKNKRESLKLQIWQLEKQLNNLIINNLWKKLDNKEKEIYEKEKNRLQEAIDILQEDLNSLNSDFRDYLLEVETFFDLLNKTSEYYTKAKPVRKKKIVKLFFSNIIVGKKTVKLTIKPEFKELFSHLVDLTGIEPVSRHKAV